MSRSRAIETRLEKLIPSLDEYFTSGFLTRPESQEVARQRTHWEYRLVAKPLLLLDVRNAVEYELGLEERLRQHCVTTKLHLKHRWTILERIEGIYHIGLKHLRDPNEKEALRREFVVFLKQYSRMSSLSKAYAGWMMQFPTRHDIWVEAMLWEGVEQRKMDDARAMAQQALLTMSNAPDVWACALKLELHFVGHLLDGLVAQEQDEQLKRKAQASSTATLDGDESEMSGVQTAQDMAEKLRAENAAMGSILLDLALAKTVVEEAIASPCSGPALVEKLLGTAGEYAFARPVTAHIADLAMARVVDTAMNPSEDRHGRKLRTATPSAPATATGAVTAQRVRTAWISSTPVTNSHSGGAALSSNGSTESLSARPLAGGVDLLSRCYLSLPVLQLHYTATTSSSSSSSSSVCDPVSHMACALDGAAGAAQWELSPQEREQAVLDALMAVLDFFVYVPLCIEEGSQVTIEARERAASVRTLLEHLVPSTSSSSPSSTSSSSTTAVAAAACVHRVVRDLLTKLTLDQRAGVSALCRRLLSLQDSVTATQTGAAWPALRTLALSLAHYCARGEPADADAEEADAENQGGAGGRKGKKKGKKGNNKGSDAADVLAATAREHAPEPVNRLVDDAKARVKTVLDRVSEAAAVAAPPSTRARHETTSADSGVLADIFHFPVALFGSFLSKADQDALMAQPRAGAGQNKQAARTAAAAVAVHPKPTERLSEESVERFMTWWRARAPASGKPASPQHAHRDGDGGDGDEASEPIVITDAAHLLEARQQCRDSAAALVHPHLPRTTTATKSATATTAAPATSTTLSALRARRQPFLAVESPSARGEAPLNLWRVFAALESLDGGDMELPATSSSGARAHAADSDSSSSDDEDESMTAKQAGVVYPNYATAGIAFLATASCGALSRSAEWERVLGIHALLRCRLASLTEHNARVLRREELVELLLESALPSNTRLSSSSSSSSSSLAVVSAETRSGADGAWLPTWMQDMLATVREAQQRCHPLARFTQAGFVIPLYEAIAELCVRHAHKFLRGRGALDERHAARHWLAEARSAHEQLLALYGMSRHLESFVPVLFNGKPSVSAAQSDRVASVNTTDWLAYVAFERDVAKDLARAATVSERARRSALNPQEVLVKLMNL